MSLHNEIKRGNRYMSFFEAIKICLTKYMDFTGRASRSEFWWFSLLWWSITLGLDLIHYHTLSIILSIPLILPAFAVQARRLHDIDKSGWWQLIMAIPFIGIIILFYWSAKKGNSNQNQYGELPA